MNMIEKVARAIHATTYLTPTWNHLNVSEKESYVISARAAIEAMREPTQAMIEAMKTNGYSQSAGFKTVPPHQSISVTPIWQAGIDAALKEE